MFRSALPILRRASQHVSRKSTFPLLSSLTTNSSWSSSSSHSFHTSTPTPGESLPRDPSIDPTLVYIDEKETEHMDYLVMPPEYTLPAVILTAVPAIVYEWYVINEETLLLGVFILVCTIVYREAGGQIMAAWDAETNADLQKHLDAEDMIINKFTKELDEINFNKNMLQDMQDIKALKVECYEKLNEAGKNQPMYTLKEQMERLLHVVKSEEANATEKAKYKMMQEATAKVTAAFANSDELKKKSLANAIAQLKGTPSQDVVKDAFLKVFKEKSIEAKNIDPAQEIKDNRANLVQKLNAVAGNEGYMFRFGPDGTPKLI